MKFQAGDKWTGNKRGRPVGSTSLTTKIKAALSEYADGGNGKTYEQLYIKAILKKAIVDQDPTIMKILWNYYDGMPSQKIEGDINGNIIIEVAKEIAEKNNLDYVPTSSTGSNSKG